MLQQPSMLWLLPCLLLLLSHCQQRTNAAPPATSNSFASVNETSTSSGTAATDITDALIVVDEQIVLLWPNETSATNNSSQQQQQQQQQPADNESALDVADDLIFLTKKTKQPTTEQQQLSRPDAAYQQIDLLTSAEQDTFTADNNNNQHKSNDNCSETYISFDVAAAADANANINANIDAVVAAFGVPQQIELHRFAGEAETVAPAAITPIDMSDFVTLIPTEEVKSIASNYYHNDAEVRRAYAYLRSADFKQLRQHIIELPEVAAFLRYLNNSGLDVMRFLYTLTNLTESIAHNDKYANSAASSEEVNAQSSEELRQQEAASMGNEITQMEFSALKVTATATSTAKATNEIISTTASNNIATPTTLLHPTATTLYSIPTLSTTITTAATMATTLDVTSMPPKQHQHVQQSQQQESTEQQQQQEQLNGLHGLLDGILNILPQDQILATFFDKLETNEQFSKLVNDIGNPTFAKILSKMQQSLPLRNLIFTLHNNGIYITRIVDSLKAYFFLGGFS